MKKSEFIELWLQALESGKYKQAKNALVREDNKDVRYCCLGVACVVSNINKVRTIDLQDRDDELMPNILAKFLGIVQDGRFEVPVYHNGNFYNSLTELNDRGVRFKSIAKIIRENWEVKNFSKWNLD